MCVTDSEDSVSGDIIHRRPLVTVGSSQESKWFYVNFSPLFPAVEVCYQIVKINQWVHPVYTINVSQ